MRVASLCRRQATGCPVQPPEYNTPGEPIPHRYGPPGRILLAQQGLIEPDFHPGQLLAQASHIGQMPVDHLGHTLPGLLGDLPIARLN